MRNFEKHVRLHGLGPTPPTLQVRAWHTPPRTDDYKWEPFSSPAGPALRMKQPISQSSTFYSEGLAVILRWCWRYRIVMWTERKNSEEKYNKKLSIASQISRRGQDFITWYRWGIPMAKEKKKEKEKRGGD